MANSYLYMKNISKTFDKKQALVNVDLKVNKGTIHGLLGENGAGKSVLMSILSGSRTCDTGQIFINGQQVSIDKPSDALKLGILTIYQYTNLVNDLSVTENLFLGQLPKKKITRRVDWKGANQLAKQVFERLQFDIDPAARVFELNYTQKRMVEVARALVHNVNILILDEAYIGLSDVEQRVFFDILSSLKKDGLTIIYLSHNIDEVVMLCDDFTVLKGGENVLEFRKGEISKDDIIRAIVGGTIKKNFPRIYSENKRLLLKVDHISTKHALDDLTFLLYKGEILGIAGLVGSGRSGLGRALFGLDKITTGNLYLNNTEISISSPVDAIDLGIGYLPEDMIHESLNTNFDISSNITMANIKSVSGLISIDKNKERQITRDFIKKFLIQTPSLDERISNLSQGNQQKVHLSKWIQASSRIFIMDEPTNGIDVGTRVDIYNYMNNFVLNGNSIIFISSNIEELMGMSDRILIIKDGTSVACLEHHEFSKETILRYAAES